MKRFFSIFVLVLIAAHMVWAESEAERIESAAIVMNEIMSTPDKGIPEEILNSAQCVAVVPSMLKGGFIVGGAHGKGVATCRTENGSWSAPAPFAMSGGSVGLQIGVQGVDLIMVITNERGMQNLLSSKFKLGADVSVAAGPVGRHAEGATDWKLRAEVLTYSRARGLFAGVSVNGAVIGQDKDATRELFGRLVPFRTILTGAVATPTAGEPFINSVRKATPKKDSGQAAPKDSTPPAQVPEKPAQKSPGI
ncbi:MAG TPA: lipid-binding SYLF domain-containing protein [Candidatus Angelobacter sp.]|nr:lipid-binding SYLF domain-containing protein [Candidatus Angelobacter sp.]